MAEIPVTLTPRRANLLALGFRPFFLAAGGSAALLMTAWLAALGGWIAPEHYYGAVSWHAHEMLFGYSGAVITGFLLTATRNWTGIDTLAGPGLGALALLWLAARITPFLSVPGILVATLDAAFFPLLAASLFRPLWGGKNQVNRVFLLLMAGMWLASMLVHLQALGVTTATASKGIRLMLDLVILTMLLVAGRIMPFFTRAAVPGARSANHPLVERITFIIAPLSAAANLFSPGASAGGILLLILGSAQVLRFAGWHDKRVWGNPMLAVLYAGYLWLTAGFLLDGVAGLGLLSPYPALHALTTGAVGVFTLGMMVRVTLGHTGREMRASGLTNLAFLLVNLAAVTRVFAPLLLPGLYSSWLLVSGLLWISAFILFLWIYAPMLIAPRVDGRPG